MEHRKEKKLYTYLINWLKALVGNKVYPFYYGSYYCCCTGTAVELDWIIGLDNVTMMDWDSNEWIFDARKSFSMNITITYTVNVIVVIVIHFYKHHHAYTMNKKEKRQSCIISEKLVSQTALVIDGNKMDGGMWIWW